ncbi:hypothetical protein ACHAXA_002171 [Cyclostephanos tholiformis]|uniref:Uncharacterized protein n=1 Tax=Cyclostephanos tholiformis TaxID=382380 RepID=A0ABD3R9T5_9STRA
MPGRDLLAQNWETAYPNASPASSSCVVRRASCVVGAHPGPARAVSFLFGVYIVVAGRRDGRIDVRREATGIGISFTVVVIVVGGGGGTGTGATMVAVAGGGSFGLGILAGLFLVDIERSTVPREIVSTDSTATSPCRPYRSGVWKKKENYWTVMAY